MKAIIKLIPMLLLFVNFSSVADETDSMRIISAQYDTVGFFQFIPNDALSGDYDAIFIRHEFDVEKVETKTSLEISWQSTYIDGAYELVFTPKQVYLRSVHNNPNPNYLYWITNINNAQYELIKSFLETYDKKVFDNYTSEYSLRHSYSYKKYIKEKYGKDDWEDKCFENLTKVVKIINKALKSQEKIILPDKKEFKKIRPKLILSSKKTKQKRLQNRINQ